MNERVNVTDHRMEAKSNNVLSIIINKSWLNIFSRTCAGGTHAVELGAGESEGRPSNAKGKTIMKTLAW